MLYECSEPPEHVRAFTRPPIGRNERRCAKTIGSPLQRKQGGRRGLQGEDDGRLARLRCGGFRGSGGEEAAAGPISAVDRRTAPGRQASLASSSRRATPLKFPRLLRRRPILTGRFLGWGLRTRSRCRQRGTYTTTRAVRDYRSNCYALIVPILQCELSD